MNNKDTIERAVSIMETWANDPRYGYDQQWRWGERGDYDCSSAAITAWEQAGVPVKSRGATYTGNMYPVFLACGFRDVTALINRASGDGLQRGDVLLNRARHTALYCGGGQEVEASINELGTATGGAPGDQTGREFLVRPYRDYPWDCVLRYYGGETDAPSPVDPPQEHEIETCEVTIPTVRMGDTGAAVAALQAALKHTGFDPVWIDGEAGPRTVAALRAFQESAEIEPHGICGAETWAAIMRG